jgi:hypothetical protein
VRVVGSGEAASAAWWVRARCARAAAISSRRVRRRSRGSSQGWLNRRPSIHATLSSISQGSAIVSGTTKHPARLGWQPAGSRTGPSPTSGVDAAASTSGRHATPTRKGLSAGRQSTPNSGEAPAYSRKRAATMPLASALQPIERVPMRAATPTVISPRANWYAAPRR